MVFRPCNLRLSAHSARGLIHLPEQAEWSIKDSRQLAPVYSQGDVSTASLHQPMLQRIERGLGCSRCRLRGEGDVFRKNLSCSDGSEIERGHASDGAGAKRLAHPAEIVYVMRKQAQVERNMGATAFDTLRVAKRLGAAGFDSGQAESLATIFAESITDKLATKDDLGDLEKRLDIKIDTVEKRLTSKIESVEERMTSKIGSVEERMTSKIESVEERMTSNFERHGIHVGMQIASLKTDIAEGHIAIQRWMIGLLITMFLGVGGMILVITRLMTQVS